MNQYPRPRFDTLWPGPWDIPPARGVGIRLNGKPSDPSKLIAILNGHSCPHDVSWQIAAVLQSGQEKVTTVMAHLNFDALAIQLRAVGVKLEIVEPR